MLSNELEKRRKSKQLPGCRKTKKKMKPLWVTWLATSHLSPRSATHETSYLKENVIIYLIKRNVLPPTCSPQPKHISFHYHSQPGSNLFSNILTPYWLLMMIFSCSYQSGQFERRPSLVTRFTVIHVLSSLSLSLSLRKMVGSYYTSATDWFFFTENWIKIMVLINNSKMYSSC